MELNVSDTITASPTAADIARAFDAKPHDEDWYIVLDREDGESIDAHILDDGHYALAFIDKGERYKAKEPVDAATLKFILLDYLKGKMDWAGTREFVIATSKTEKAKIARRMSSEPPFWAIVLVVAAFSSWQIISFLPSSWLAHLPFHNSEWFPLWFIFGPMAVMILAMIANKLIQARRSANWPQAAGRITKSGIIARERKFAGEATTIRNEPDVAYEFQVAGKKYTGSRIGVGEDSGGLNMQATLARYPVGGLVMVYYAPDDPDNCVLERGIPKDVPKGCAIILGFLAAIGGGIYWLVNDGMKLITPLVPNGNAPFVVAATGFGCLVLLFFIAMRNITRKASHWPVTSGKVMESRIESFNKTEDGRTRTYFTPVIEYEYHVGGQSWRSRQINLNMQLEGSESYAKGVAARYPKGSAVQVRYDPANPGQAALELPKGMAWIMLAVALFCFGVAAWAGGFFK